MEQFDLIVVGNGSAGDNIARTLGRRGLRVAVVEREHLGGECLNDGCAPSKALISLSRRAAVERLSWNQIVARIHATQLLIRGSDPNGGMRADGIELIWGDPVFRSPASLSVDGRDLAAKNVVVATGTAPGLPPIPGIAEARPLTNRTIFTMPALPASLAIIGGGPIGLELGPSGGSAPT